MQKQIADRIICLRDIIPIQATSNSAQAKLDAGSTVHGVLAVVSVFAWCSKTAQKDTG